VFTGPRIAVKILFDYLAEGERIDDFLKQYPSVSREQAIAAIEEVEALPEESAQRCASSSTRTSGVPDAGIPHRR